MIVALFSIFFSVVSLRIMFITFKMIILIQKLAQQKQLERDAIMGTTMMAGQKRKMVPGTPDMSRKMPRITPAKAPMPVKAATTAGKVLSRVNK
jgi:hypothetical protein